jgi:nucleoside-diphosphate-sugar epimerase
MKKILVTGATGFVGSHIVQRLLGFPTFSQYRIIASSANEKKAANFPWIDQVKYIPLDLRGFSPANNYFEYFQRPDALIHLAWEGLPNYKNKFHVEDNLPRHYLFLKNMIENGLKDLTVPGTCLEYGMQEGCLKEDRVSVPETSYGIAKDELRKSLDSLKKNHEFLFKWARLFYTYGKGQNPNSLLSQLDSAIAEKRQEFNMSGGEQQRDYLPVEKVADYLIRIALQKKVTGIINCCSGIPVTVKEFVENYLKAKNIKMKLNLGYYPYPDYEPMRFWGDNHKLTSILNDE